MRYDPSEPRPRRPRAPRACGVGMGVGVRASSIAADRPPPAAPGRMCASARPDRRDAPAPHSQRDRSPAKTQIDQDYFIQIFPYKLYTYFRVLG